MPLISKWICYWNCATISICFVDLMKCSGNQRAIHYNLTYNDLTRESIRRFKIHRSKSAFKIAINNQKMDTMHWEKYTSCAYMFNHQLLSMMNIISMNKILWKCHQWEQLNGLMCFESIHINRLHRKQIVCNRNFDVKTWTKMSWLMFFPLLYTMEIGIAS